MHTRNMSSVFYAFLIEGGNFNLAATVGRLVEAEAEELRAFRGLKRYRSNLVACEAEAGRYYDDDIMRELTDWRGKPEPSDILDNRRTANAWAIAHSITVRGLGEDARIAFRTARAAEEMTD